MLRLQDDPTARMKHKVQRPASLSGNVIYAVDDLCFTLCPTNLYALACGLKCHTIRQESIEPVAVLRNIMRLYITCTETWYHAHTKLLHVGVKWNTSDSISVPLKVTLQCRIILAQHSRFLYATILNLLWSYWTGHSPSPSMGTFEPKLSRAESSHTKNQNLAAAVDTYSVTLSVIYFWNEIESIKVVSISWHSYNALLNVHCVLHIGLQILQQSI